MIIRNGENFIEIKDRITVGIRDRYIFMKTPKLKYDEKGALTLDTNIDYEENPNLFLLSKILIKMEEDGIDKTPQDKTLSGLIKVLDNDFYDFDLIKRAIEEGLKLYGFIEKEEEKKED